MADTEMTPAASPPNEAPLAETAAQAPAAPTEAPMTDDVPAANGDAAAIESPPAEVPEATADVPPAPEPEPAPAEPAPPPVKTEAPLPVRQYLEATVVPVLMQAMQQLVKDRPEDPIGFVADYLISHNPKKQKVDHNTDNNATS